jgi:hypothetical protein
MIVIAGADGDGGFIAATRDNNGSTNSIISWLSSKLYKWLEIDFGLLCKHTHYYLLLTYSDANVHYF